MFSFKRCISLFTEINNRKGGWLEPSLSYSLINAVCGIHSSSDKKTTCQILSYGKEKQTLTSILKRNFTFNFLNFCFATGRQVGLN